MLGGRSTGHAVKAAALSDISGGTSAPDILLVDREGGHQPEFAVSGFGRDP